LKDKRSKQQLADIDHLAEALSSSTSNISLGSEFSSQSAVIAALAAAAVI
jgi:hypothetical protein